MQEVRSVMGVDGGKRGLRYPELMSTGTEWNLTFLCTLEQDGAQGVFAWMQNSLRIIKTLGWIWKKILG